MAARPWSDPVSAPYSIESNYKARWYVRITMRDQFGVIKNVGEAAETHSVSIHAILQNPIVTRELVDFVVTTDETSREDIEAFSNAIAAMPWALAQPFLMTML